MKCFLCSSKFKDQKELLGHYLSDHNIDENSWVSKNYFRVTTKLC